MTSFQYGRWFDPKGPFDVAKRMHGSGIGDVNKIGNTPSPNASAKCLGAYRSCNGPPIIVKVERASG